MATLTPQRSVTQQRPVPVSPSRRLERRLSVMPRILFLLAAAFMLLAPVIAMALDADGNYHLEPAAFFLVGVSPGITASAVMLGLIAEPGRVVSRKLRTWIGVGLATLLADVVATVLVPFLAGDPGSVSIPGVIAITVAYLALTGYVIAFVGTLITNQRAGR